MLIWTETPESDLLKHVNIMLDADLLDNILYIFYFLYYILYITYYILYVYYSMED